MKHTAESRQQADSAYAAYVKEAYCQLALWCQGQHKTPTGFETFSTGVEAGIAWQRNQPLQAAALAALVACRKQDLASTAASERADGSFAGSFDAYLTLKRAMWDAADALIAAEGGTG